MKIFFGANITQDKTNNIVDGNCFIDRELTEKQVHELVENLKFAETLNKEMDLSKPVEWLGIASACVVGGSLVLGLRLIADMSWPVFLLNCSWLIYVFIASVVFTAIYFWLVMAKADRVSKDEKFQRDMEIVKNRELESREHLDLPENTAKADVLMCFYKIKNGEPAIKKQRGSNFVNPQMEVCRADDALYIASLSCRWRIPLDSITAIRTVKKTTILASWNKEIPYYKGEYKKYKIGEINGCPVIRCYHALCITRDGEDYELYIPSYELPLFEQLTGLTAEI